MAQVRKPEIEARLRRAALEVFARDGYLGASMARIAAEAGLSTGNTYHYFAGKDELFYAVVGDELAATFLRLVKRRVASLVTSDALTALSPEAEADAQALLGFWVEHRLEVVILLAHARGSRHEPFRAEFVRTLLAPARKKIVAELGGTKLPSEADLVLRTVFENTAQALVAILSECDDGPAIGRAFSAFWAYQLAGLAGLTRRICA